MKTQLTAQQVTSHLLPQKISLTPEQFRHIASMLVSFAQREWDSILRSRYGAVDIVWVDFVNAVQGKKETRVSNRVAGLNPTYFAQSAIDVITHTNGGSIFVWLQHSQVVSKRRYYIEQITYHALIELLWIFDDHGIAYTAHELQQIISNINKESSKSLLSRVKLCLHKSIYVTWLCVNDIVLTIK